MMREQGRKGGLLGAAREDRRRRHRAAATLRVRVLMCCASMHHALLSPSRTPAAAADVSGDSSSRRPTAVHRRAWGDSAAGCTHRKGATSGCSIGEGRAGSEQCSDGGRRDGEGTLHTQRSGRTGSRAAGRARLHTPAASTHKQHRVQRTSEQRIPTHVKSAGTSGRWPAGACGGRSRPPCSAQRGTACARRAGCCCTTTHCHTACASQHAPH